MEYVSCESKNNYNRSTLNYVKRFQFLVEKIGFKKYFPAYGASSFTCCCKTMRKVLRLPGVVYSLEELPDKTLYSEITNKMITIIIMIIKRNENIQRYGLIYRSQRALKRTFLIFFWNSFHSIFQNIVISEYLTIFTVAWEKLVQ